MSKTAMMLIPPVFPTIPQPAHLHMNPGFVQTVHQANQSPDVVTMREVNRLIGESAVPAVQVATKFGEAVAFVGRMRADARGSRGTGNHFHVLWVDGKRWSRSRATNLNRFVAAAIASASMMIQDVSIQTLAHMLPLLYARIMSDTSAAVGLPFNVGAMPQRDTRAVPIWREPIKRGRFGEAVISLPEGESFEGSVAEIGDAQISFQSPDYTRGGFDQLFVVRTPDYFRQVANWNRAFMLCHGIINMQPLVLITHVEQPRGTRSSHTTIREGLRQLLGYELEPHEIKRLEFARGYIRPGEGNRYEVYSLSGAKMFERDGSLSEHSISVQNSFRTMLNIDVDVVEGDDVSLRTQLH